ncbi:putative acid phosphatase [Rosellinia necatrix]|uniref:Putative acid phosphatase n=1 Tax=Rosellinia necatrix TaxID=77044 RepID=A0A1W2TQ16_ROSNE|nr:putative acid phosphatase [Rosellinia necatrix]
MVFKGLLLSLAALPLAKTETVLGVYIFSRHGDRTPKALAPTNLTSLGAQQAYTSGGYYRNRYVASDADSPVFGLSRDVAALTQLTVTAPLDNVLQNSAQAFLQGLYPPAGDFSTQELRNDETVTAPLGGYQYVPVNMISSLTSSTNPEDNPWLQGGSGCDKAVVSSNNYLSSTEYASTYKESEDFYQSLLPVINTTFETDEANFKNAYAIFDYINVATIHNQTIPASDLLTSENLRELKLLADVHEWNLAYNSTDEIRAIAGATLAGQIVEALNDTITGHGKQPVHIQFGAYASFLSFFGLAQLPAVSADFTGVVGYSSTMAFELVTNASVGSGSAGYPSADDISVRFLFSNGSAADVTPTVYPLFGQGETLLPWTSFVSGMKKFAIGDTPDWCRVCGVTTGSCASLTAGSGSGDAASASASGSGGISLPVAGVIGALVTLAVVIGAEALIYVISGVTLVKKSTLAAQVSATTAGSKA